MYIHVPSLTHNVYVLCHSMAMIKSYPGLFEDYSHWSRRVLRYGILMFCSQKNTHPTTAMWISCWYWKRMTIGGGGGHFCFLQQEKWTCIKIFVTDLCKLISPPNNKSLARGTFINTLNNKHNRVKTYLPGGGGGGQCPLPRSANETLSYSIPYRHLTTYNRCRRDSK